jgi:hypothetical protein
VKFGFWFRARSQNYFAWKVISLRHVSLREMGWSRKPYEFRSPARSKSKGEATYGIFRQHAFLASKSFAAKYFERLSAFLGFSANIWTSRRNQICFSKKAKI